LGSASFFDDLRRAAPSISQERNFNLLINCQIGLLFRRRCSYRSILTEGVLLLFSIPLGFCRAGRLVGLAGWMVTGAIRLSAGFPGAKSFDFGFLAKPNPTLDLGVLCRPAIWVVNIDEMQKIPTLEAPSVC
jgi:hypothetical protein